MNRRNFLGTCSSAVMVGLAGGAVVTGITGVASAASIFTGSTDGVAINGYDPVAYFKVGKPVLGSADHLFKWQGVVWHFSSEENKTAFMAEPEKFAPKYGGFCAYAMAQGAKAQTVPEAFSIVDGALYLNYSTGVRERWNVDRSRYIQQADKAWPKTQ